MEQQDILHWQYLSRQQRVASLYLFICMLKIRCIILHNWVDFQSKTPEYSQKTAVSLKTKLCVKAV